MLYHLAEWLRQYESAFNVFGYLTFRAILGVLTALIFSFMVGPWMIRKLHDFKFGQVIREVGPKSHQAKTGTPTMGGVLILVAITIATLLWADLSNRFIWFALFVTTAFGLVGFADDYIKIKHRRNLGLTARQKYFWLSLAGFGISTLIFVTAKTPTETTLIVPFIKDIAISLGVFFIPWTYLVIVGSSNAVNLTDGLDGLAIMPTVLVASALAQQLKQQIVDDNRPGGALLIGVLVGALLRDS